ncbi:MAG: hypothetical protein MUP49_00440 [Dehalococcoidia bacterium]|nr:hypothetical protein [Dehalococcoidia bacterium]
MAVEELNQALSAIDMDGIWYSIQAFLLAVGNVSKLLWPPDEHFAKRGAELRKSLSVGDNSPLAPRRFRNHFEHFDERLEKWAISSGRHNFADSNVGPPNMIVGLDPGDYLRNFDPVNLTITFRGDTYHMKPIIDSIQTLWQKAEVEAQRPYFE